MTQGSHALHFYYDAQGKPGIVIYDGTAYGYLYNLQGDVVALVNGSGTKVVEYTYDAWGKPTGKTGTMAGTLGTVQPFRYRGYVYDEETGLYYLRSRYYRPEWCRFVTSDQIIKRSLFCYSDNTPINKIDTNGRDAIWLQERNSAFYQGHSGLLAQDEDSNWYYFFWGPTEGSSIFGMIVDGVKLDAYYIPVATDDYNMKELSAVQAAVRNSCHPERADLITDIYYFEGDYIATHKKAKEIASRMETEKYYLFANNCVQRTLEAFCAADDRFELAIAACKLPFHPNSMAPYIAMIPSKKDEEATTLLFLLRLQMAIE